MVTSVLGDDASKLQCSVAPHTSHYDISDSRFSILCLSGLVFKGAYTLAEYPLAVSSLRSSVDEIALHRYVSKYDIKIRIHHLSISWCHIKRSNTQLTNTRVDGERRIVPLHVLLWWTATTTEARL